MLCLSLQWHVCLIIIVQLVVMGLKIWYSDKPFNGMVPSAGENLMIKFRQMDSNSNSWWLTDVAILSRQRHDIVFLSTTPLLYSLW